MRSAFTIGRSFSADEWRLYSPGKKYRKTFDELPDPRQRNAKKRLRRAQNISQKHYVK
jgi:hypothetical protein